MSSRADILEAIRQNRPQVERPLPAVPWFDDAPPPSLLATFKDSLLRMGGLFLDPPTSGDPLAPVREKIASAEVVCATVPEIGGNRNIADVQAAHDLGARDFAIGLASFAVAVTGSVRVSDADLRVTPGAHLP